MSGTAKRRGAGTPRKQANGAGRPPAYKSAEEMQGRIDDYFTKCEGEVVIDNTTGNPMLNKRGEVVYIGRRPPTVTGLALALGFTSRQSLLNYEARNKGFARVLRIAKSRIEQYNEERLDTQDGCRGAQFNLRNNFPGWAGEVKRGGQDVEDLRPLAELLGVGE